MTATDRERARNPFLAGMLRPAQRALAMLRLEDDWTLVASAATLDPAPPRIEPERLGRFALWGFRGSGR